MPQAPAEPKIYHIVHVNRLASIVSDGCLWSDAEVVARGAGDSTVGMSHIAESVCRHRAWRSRSPTPCVALPTARWSRYAEIGTFDREGSR